MELSPQIQRDIILVSITSLIGLGFYFLNVFNIKRAHASSKANFSSDELLSEAKKKKAEASMSDESLQDISDMEEKQTDPKIELRIFKEMAAIFRNENIYLIFAFIFTTSILLVITGYYLSIRYAVCFVIGYLDFFVALTLNRKLFTRFTWHIDLSSDLLTSKRANWNMFNYYISAIFFGLNFSLSLFCIFLVSLFHHFFMDVKIGTNVALEENVHEELKFTIDFISFATGFFFYLFGKSLILVFSSIWENYRFVITNLTLSTGLTIPKTKTAFYSISFTYNMIMRTLKHNLIVTEVVIFSTLFLAKYQGTDKNFFIIFSAVLLWYLLVFGIVVTTCYNFSKLGTYLKMIAVMKIGFIYYFLTAFTFLFYRFFIKPNILIVDEPNNQSVASFSYLYLFISIFMIMIFAFHRSYSNKFPFKKIKKFKGESTKVFPYNLVVFTKISLTIIGLYFFYLFFGFLGIGIIVFILTLEDSFYKMDKLGFIFDTYVNIILEYCHTCHVSFLDLNNLYNIMDKNYFYHYVVVLFCVPLFRMDHMRYISSTPIISAESRIIAAFKILGAVLVSFLLCRLLLMLYSRMVLEDYRQIQAKGVTEYGDESDRMKYAKKYRFVLCMTIVYFVLLGILILFISHHLLLCIILGSTLQSYLLVFMNKFRIKKLSGSTKQISPEKLNQIYKEIGNSYVYLKCLCETSFGETLIEVNKLLLIIYFFLNFVKIT